MKLRSITLRDQYFYKFKSKGKILIPIFPTYMSQEDIFLYFKNLEINSNIFDCIDSVKYSLNNQRYPLFIDMHIPHNFNTKKLRLKNELRENYHFGRKEITIPSNQKYENLNYKINSKTDLLKKNNLPSKLIFKGKNKNKFDYFKVLNNIKLDETNIILIEGETLTGGIQVGLLNNENSWSKYLAQITTQGNLEFYLKLLKMKILNSYCSLFKF